MNIDENSLLATVNPIYLIGGVIITIIIGYISAYVYRNTNDFKKASRLQLIIASTLIVVLFLVGVPIILLVAFLICSFVFTALFSNYFFYK